MLNKCVYFINYASLFVYKQLLKLLSIQMNMSFHVKLIDDIRQCSFTGQLQIKQT